MYGFPLVLFSNFVPSCCTCSHNHYAHCSKRYKNEATFWGDEMRIVFILISSSSRRRCTFTYSKCMEVIETTINTLSTRGVATGVYRYIHPQNQSTLKILCGCSSPVTQDRFDMIYVHVWDINICFEIELQWLVKTYTPKSNSWLRPCVY